MLNIDSIKNSGQLSNYIAHETKRISEIETAMLTEDGDYMTFAGFGGEICAVVDDGPALITARIFGGLWGGEWHLDTFASYEAAQAYAKAALRNQLQRLAAKQLAEHRANLAALQASK